MTKKLKNQTIINPLKTNYEKNLKILWKRINYAKCAPYVSAALTP